MIKELEHLSSEKRLRDPRLFTMEKRSQRWDFINAYQYVKGGGHLPEGSVINLVG